MDTNDFAAFGTRPSVHFLLNELSYTDALYVLQIVGHAHPVFCSVSRVEMFQPVAGEFTALEAISGITSREHPTLFYPAQGPGLWLRMIIVPAPRARILFPDIGAAEAAVHPAGGDQARCHRL